MPLIRNYEYYDHIDEFARKNGSMTTIPTRYVRNGKARIDEGDWRVSMNSTIHDPTDFDDLIDSNSNEMHNCSMFVEETRKKKRWKDLLFSKGKRSSRKEKKENIEPNHIHIINRSLSSVSFRNDPQYLKYYKPKRGESVSLSRNRYQTQPSMNLIIPNQYHHRNYKKTSIGYSDIGSPSSSHTSPDYDNSNLPQPSYVIYPASSLIPSRNYMIPSVNPSVQGKQRIFRSATYNDAFVNSQEWTMSRTISEMRLGIVGTAQSGKTSLVHRYLTGSYTSEDSPEGGRFKKEVVIEGQSHLLLIRDEGQQHLDVQFCQWVDAVVFVFSVCSKNSFDSIKSLAHEMNKYRNISDLPLLLVGTKDNISEKKARVIAEEEGRQMAASMKKCIYYETSSTHGTNVERVFKDACCKIIQQRIRTQLGVVTSQARTPTPTHQDNRKDYQDPRHMSATIFAAPSTVRQSAGGGYSTNSSSSRRSGVFHHRDPGSSTIRSGSERSMSAMLNTGPYGTSYRSNCGTISPSSSQKSIPSLSIMNGVGSGGHSRSSAALLDNDNISGQHLNTYSIDSLSGTPTTPTSQGLAHTGSQVSASTSHLPTPSSTPNTQRKNRRISNIFQRPKDNQEEKTKAIEALNLGVGRAIPVKQGLLYKKSTKSALNREWKKKYVCLYSDGRLAYHQNLKDYMDKTAHGKEVFLGLATVKVSGRQRPRNTQRTIGATNTSSGGGASENNGTPTLKNYESRKSDVGVIISGDGTSGGASDDAIKENQRNTIHFTPPAQPMTVAGKQKKRDTHRRIGSSGKHNDEDDECFEIVTHNQQRWEFCAASTEERDEWVSAIEEQIELALTAQMSQPTTRATANKAQVQAIRLIDGNDRCADCETLNPDWASLNLGTLICIECSGIHRNLGTHVSKVRSLELDGWPLEYLAVMQSIGNEIANRMWEFNIGREKKPTSESSREEKEWWIDRKYKQKAFLEPLRKDESIGAQLVGAVLARDVAKTSLLLANGITTKDVNAPVSVKDRRTVLHLACSIGSLEIVQLLLWNNADIRALDENGRSCLWYAQNNGFLECVEVLITAGLSPDYGCPKSNGIGGGGSYQNHTTMISCGESGNELPEGAIIGSMANRDYSCIGDEVYGRRGGAPPPIARRNIAHKQQSAAPSEIDLMPASMI